MAQPFIPVIRQAVFNQTANNVRNGDERPKSTHAYTHGHTHFCHSSRFFQQNPWKEPMTAGTEAGINSITRNLIFISTLKKEKKKKKECSLFLN